MTVRITREHCINSSYTEPQNCPLYHAIKEQHPEFPLLGVGISMLATTDDRIYTFDPKKWNGDVAENVLNGLQEECVLEIVKN